jgi:hypothetical protein
LDRCWQLDISKVAHLKFKVAIHTRVKNSIALVRGTVEDRQGLPVPGVLVTVESGSAPYPDTGILSDEKGYFNIYLPSGHFRLGAHSPCGDYGTAECDSDADKYLLIHLDKN